MKQSLQLRLGQQITMTPQLQQAIRLLQLSTIELQVEIQQVLDSNIMLEVAESDEDEDTDLDEVERVNGSEVTIEIGSSTQQQEFSTPETNEEEPELAENYSNIPEELAVDSDWEELYDSGAGQYDHPTHDGDRDKDFTNQGSTEETLQDYLLWQLELTPFNAVERIIATALIDAIDGNGYLTISLEEVVNSVQHYAGTEEQKKQTLEEITVEEVEMVLHRMQRFDPPGIFARNLQECLLLQLEEMGTDISCKKAAACIIKDHLELLASRDYVQLSRRSKINREDLSEAIELIQSLNPRPGTCIESHRSTYIVPDAFVRKLKGQWHVELNPEITPKLRINAHYARLIVQSENRSDVASLKTHLQEARWFIKSLRSRHETLLKVAKCIVKRQSAFLEYGDEAMRPLVLHDIATELEMHESTISRVTTQKYIHTPRGIFELKYFFSSHVSTESGGECSSTAIRALIKKLIAAENTAKPLSDSKIAKLLSERGIKVARRTVAKYREAMVIPPSNERKRLS